MSAQTPSTHSPLQQASPSAEHGWLSSMQALSLQCPLAQLPLQQSRLLEQAKPAVRHSLLLRTHTIGVEPGEPPLPPSPRLAAAGAQSPEQQSEPCSQGEPGVPHSIGGVPPVLPLGP